MTNLSLFVAESADMYPDSIALRSTDFTTTYSELHVRLRQLSGYLAQIGIQPGDRVGVMLPNTLAFALAYYGILHAGAIVVPMNPLQSAREVEFFLANTGAQALLAAPDNPASTAGGGPPACAVWQSTTRRPSASSTGARRGLTRSAGRTTKPPSSCTLRARQ